MPSPFKIHVEDSQLEDLYERLDRTRWPDEVGQNWQYGTDLTYLKELCDYWRHDYDWRAQEALLNRFDHFKTTLTGVHSGMEGRQLHFIHQRSANADAMPIVITHGWPGSITEFMKIIEPLTDPASFGGKSEDAFHVVCPSIPGYGFSDAPTSPGFDQKCAAEVNVQLMAQLGYEYYGAHGGDWGSAISTWTGLLAPGKVTGIHLTLIFAAYPKDKKDPMEGVSEQEQELLNNRRAYMREETGYQQIQGTKPQTLGYGLNDSPVGLAAWITEKFRTWTDCDGNIENAISKDELLTNIMVYWITGSITSSTRLYYESRHANNAMSDDRIEIPTGCSIFPAELYIPPRRWVEDRYNLTHWSVHDKGGHFAALEQPGALVEDIRDFFRPLRRD